MGQLHRGRESPGSQVNSRKSTFQNSPISPNNPNNPGSSLTGGWDGWVVTGTGENPNAEEIEILLTIRGNTIQGIEMRPRRSPPGYWQAVP